MSPPGQMLIDQKTSRMFLGNRKILINQARKYEDTVACVYGVGLPAGTNGASQYGIPT